MNLRQSLALTLKTSRKIRQLTQEDFDVVSSRTYMSSLERGLKSPTIDKLDEIAQTMDMHPASIILAAYAFLAGPKRMQATIDRVLAESSELLADLATDKKPVR